jgi:hypothetical protein
MAKGKRSGVDWSKHVVSTDPHGNTVVIHTLGIPGSKMQEVVFINCQGVMTVTGDYGIWVFNREFMPSPKESEVIEHYWCEKATGNTSQEIYEFDPEGTEALIDEWIVALKQESPEGHSGQENVLIDYLESCRSIIHDGDQYYRVRAHDLKPNSVDRDQVPYQSKIKTWLLIVFDAWEEICRQLREE